MVELTLVRHGQAQTGATDEASYDNLSPLGRQQADWLGEHLARTDRRFDRIISGTLHRQHDTARIIATHMGVEVQQDPRLNELDYFGLAQSLKDTHALEMPTDRASFVAHVPQVLTAWEAGDIHAHLESFDRFQHRIASAISDAEAEGGQVMFVTSGGVIGMAMRLMLGLEVKSYASVLLQIYNTSLHRYIKVEDTLALDCFNAIPHLEPRNRAEARTFI